MDLLEAILGTFWPTVTLDGPGPAALLSFDQLREIMTHLRPERARAYLPDLVMAMREGEIDRPLRSAAFLSQIAHESAELWYWEELASGQAYEGRKDLGNTEPGDGVRYKGRGPIQLTGRLNYRTAGQALVLDLENHPELVKEPSAGFRTTVWFWITRGLNKLADARDFRGITRRINGGYNGLAHREEYYRRALRVLGGNDDA